jgi:hypothetical protein
MEFRGWAGFKLLVRAMWRLIRKGNVIVILPRDETFVVADDFGVQK